MFAGFPLGNQIGDFGLSALGLVEPGDQRIVAFLVFRLVEGDMASVFCPDYIHNY